MIVIASIHQPNWETFSLFDKVLLLAQGKTMFFGAIGKWRPCSLKVCLSFALNILPLPQMN